MLNPSEMYRRKLTSADQAVSMIRSGERVYVHPGCAAPSVLTEALLQRASSLHDVEILHLLTFGKADYTLPQYDGHFRHNALFMGANVRESVGAGRADYTPIMLGEIEKLFCSGEMPLDVAAREQPAVQPAVVDQQDLCAVRGQHQPGRGDVSWSELVPRERRRSVREEHQY